MARQFSTKLAVAVLGTVSALAFTNFAQADCNGCHASTSIGSHSAYNLPALSTASSSSSVTYAQAPTYGSGSSVSSGSSYGSGTTYSSAPSTSYSSGTTYSSSSSFGSSAACPSGSSKQADGTCLSTSPSMSSGSIIGGSSSFGSGSSFSSGSTYTAAPTIASGLTLGPSISSASSTPIHSSGLRGLGVNEGLRPRSCPSAVHNADGAQVLGCYDVVKPAPVPAPAPVVHTQTVVRTVPTLYHVVRPIVAVPYAVPVPCGAPQVIKTRYGFGNFGTTCGR